MSLVGSVGVIGALPLAGGSREKVGYISREHSLCLSTLWLAHVTTRVLPWPAFEMPDQRGFPVLGLYLQTVK